VKNSFNTNGNSKNFTQPDKTFHSSRNELKIEGGREREQKKVNILFYISAPASFWATICAITESEEMKIRAEKLHFHHACLHSLIRFMEQQLKVCKI
jgi:hypothetical protein